ncbi:MAG: divergent polysaccharide deacetylase family protein [Pseudomonadota bacterium]
MPFDARYTPANKAVIFAAMAVAVSPLMALGGLHMLGSGVIAQGSAVERWARSALTITAASVPSSPDIIAYRVTSPITGVSPGQALARLPSTHHQLADPLVQLRDAATAEQQQPSQNGAPATAAASPSQGKVVDETADQQDIAVLSAKPVMPDGTADIVADPDQRPVFANRIDNITTGTDQALTTAQITAPANAPAITRSAVETLGLVPPPPVIAGSAGDMALINPGLPGNEIAQPAWLKHAVSVDINTDRPKIAVVIDDLGLSRSRTQATVDLPGPLTMAFLPYANNLVEQTRAASWAGHELMLHMPMQPLSDSQDPGPRALRTDLSEAEMLRRLRTALSSFDGYVGINNHMGSKFTSNTKGMLVVLQELKRRDLMFLDSQTSGNSVAGDLAESLGMPNAKRSVFIDHEQDAVSVKRALNQLEVTARHFGVAVGIGHPHRVTIDALAEWLPGLDQRGFDLVPISAVAKLRMGWETPSQVATR